MLRFAPPSRKTSSTSACLATSYRAMPIRTAALPGSRVTSTPGRNAPRRPVRPSCSANLKTPPARPTATARRGGRAIPLRAVVCPSGWMRRRRVIRRLACSRARESGASPLEISAIPACLRGPRAVWLPMPRPAWGPKAVTASAPDARLRRATRAPTTLGSSRRSARSRFFRGCAAVAEISDPGPWLERSAFPRGRLYSMEQRGLRIAQPAVSRQIRRLEDELGASLFVRTPRGMKLSESGHEQSLTRLPLELLNGSPWIPAHELRVPIDPVQGARHDVLLCRVDRPGEGLHPTRPGSRPCRRPPRCLPIADRRAAWSVGGRAGLYGPARRGDPEGRSAVKAARGSLLRGFARRAELA